MTERLHVLLTTEGTYPFHGGGVSTWCDVLTRGLPEIDFTVLAVMMHPYLRARYELAPNAQRLLKVPLWGTEDPAEFSWHHPTSRALAVKERTTEDALAAAFVGPFRDLLRQAVQDEPDPEAAGDALLALHDFFRSHDYHRAMKSASAWEVISSVLGGPLPSGSPEAPTIGELVEASRLIHRLLTVLHFPVPVADVSHSAAAAFCGLPCVLAKLERGTPYLLTEHGVYLREQYLNVGRRVESAFLRWLLCRIVGLVVRVSYHFADEIAPVCAFNTRWERWLGVPDERLRVIYNGADAQRFAPVGRAPRARPVVVSVGMIFPLKGTLDLVEAAALVRSEVPDVLFRLHGVASDLDYHARCVARIRELGLEGCVTLPGKTDEPWRVLAEADVVALSSVSEGFPYVVIEAMLAGAAIVATDVGGVREALADAGVLVRPRRPKDMAAALVRVLRDSALRSELGARARARAEGAFTERHFREAYLDAYERLASGRARRGAGEPLRLAAG